MDLFSGPFAPVWDQHNQYIFKKDIEWLVKLLALNLLYQKYSMTVLVIQILNVA